MRSKVFAFVGLLAVFSMLMAACQPAPAATPETIVQTVIVEGQPKEVIVTATPAPAEPAAPAKKVLDFNVGVGDVPTLDPALAEDTASVQVLKETYVGLTSLDEISMEVVPGVAGEWTFSEDKKTITFKMRNDVPWVKYDAATDSVVKVQDCEGKDRIVDANDFVYGMLRTLAPATGSPYAYLPASLIAGAAEYNAGETEDVTTVGVKALDDFTVEITYKDPAVYNAIVSGLWFNSAQPQWLIEGDDCTEGRGDRWTETGFNQSYGPFVMKEWVHDSTLSIVKNPFWPGTADIPQPMLDEVVFTMLDTPAEFADYEAGNKDVSLIPLADMDRVKSDPVLSKELVIAPAASTYFYGFNTIAPFTDDIRVRQALSLAVDRQSLIDNVTKGEQLPAQWFSPPTLAGSPTLEKYDGKLGVRYDLEQAKKLLQEYLDEKKLTADKLDITLMYNTNEGHKKIAEAIQAMWKENLGVTVNVVNQEWKVFLATIKEKEAPQVFRLGWNLDYPDANNFVRDVFAVGGNNNPGDPKTGVSEGGVNWSNKEYEELVRAAALETDPAKRMEMYARAETILVWEDAVMIPIYWYTRLSVTKPYVTRTFSNDGAQRFEKWDIDMAAKLAAQGK